MNEIAAALEATALAQHLKAARWTYALVNAGHIFGLALLIGSIIPMDLRLVRGDPSAEWLKWFAAAGVALAMVFGLLLFITQATDYIANPWFQAKMLLLVLGLVNIALHPRLGELPDGRRRFVALLSLAIWPAVLLSGRMIAYV